MWKILAGLFLVSCSEYSLSIQEDEVRPPYPSETAVVFPGEDSLLETESGDSWEFPINESLPSDTSESLEDSVVAESASPGDSEGDSQEVLDSPADSEFLEDSAPFEYCTDIPQESDSPSDTGETPLIDTDPVIETDLFEFPLVETDSGMDLFEFPFVETDIPEEVFSWCVGTIGYWRNHPDQWMADTLVLGVLEYSKEDLLILLETPPQGDISIQLARQLISAKLSVVNEADDSLVSNYLNQADQWLVDNDPLLIGIPLGIPGDAEAAYLISVLDTYNSGDFGVDHC